ncbi:MAG: exsH, partial [Phenylobacterium sp.]|nr:exsH [Phenylobacterium sp.]
MPYYNYLGQPMPETGPEDNGNNHVLGTSAGNETLQAPEHNSSVAGAGGGDKLIGASGDTTFWITDPKDIVVEQANGGIDTENGWLPIKLAPNVENLVVQGTYNYGIGNALDNLIIVQNGQQNWLYGGAGNDVLAGDASPNTFVDRAGEGNDVIYNWDATDQLQLLGYGFTTAAQIRGAMTQVGPDTVIHLSGAETLTVRNTTAASFADKQFLLPLDRSKLGGLTFDDEFNSLQTYDPSKQTGLWRTDFGGNLKGAAAYTLLQNGEVEVYTHPGFQGTSDHDLGLNPLSVSNGVLTITAQQIPAGETALTYGAGYSSGMLNTFGSFEQKYGYFEMRAAVPAASGAWPAFWMMPYPFNGQGEADIMEALGSTPNVDYRRAYGGSQNVFDNAIKIDPTGFHTYGLLWTPQTVTFYFDDTAVLQAPTPASWTSPMALILNMAVGGFGGTPDPSAFPAGMQVDYVRAYGLADGSSQVTHGQFETPLGTMRADGGSTAGQANAAPTFQDSGQPVTTGHVVILSGPPDPNALPAGKSFVIWQDSGAVFGAMSNGKSLDQPTALMAGGVSQLTGTGAFLTDEKVVVGYWGSGVHGQSAWALVFDPVTHGISREELGAASGDVRFTATALGDFAASWQDPSGAVMGRSYDSFAYDGKGWYGPTTTLTGGLSGVTAGNELIVASGSGQQLYGTTNAYLSTVGTVAFSAPGLSQAESSSGVTYMTFTVNRTGDVWQKATA